MCCLQSTFVHKFCKAARTPETLEARENLGSSLDGSVLPRPRGDPAEFTAWLHNAAEIVRTGTEQAVATALTALRRPEGRVRDVPEFRRRCWGN